MLPHWSAFLSWLCCWILQLTSIPIMGVVAIAGHVRLSACVFWSEASLIAASHCVQARDATSAPSPKHHPFNSTPTAHACMCAFCMYVWMPVWVHVWVPVWVHVCVGAHLTTQAPWLLTQVRFKGVLGDCSLAVRGLQNVLRERPQSRPVSIVSWFVCFYAKIVCRVHAEF